MELRLPSGLSVLPSASGGYGDATSVTTYSGDGAKNWRKMSWNGNLTHTIFTLKAEAGLSAGDLQCKALVYGGGSLLAVVTFCLLVDDNDTVTATATSSNTIPTFESLASTLKNTLSLFQKAKAKSSQLVPVPCTTRYIKSVVASYCVEDADSMDKFVKRLKEVNPSVKYDTDSVINWRKLNTTPVDWHTTLCKNDCQYGKQLWKQWDLVQVFWSSACDKEANKWMHHEWKSAFESIGVADYIQVLKLEKESTLPMGLSTLETMPPSRSSSGSSTSALVSSLDENSSHVDILKSSINESTIKPTDIIFGKELGRGHFGIVYRGTVPSSSTSSITDIVVKRLVLPESLDRDSYMTIVMEAAFSKLMSDYENVVSFVGAMVIDDISPIEGIGANDFVSHRTGSDSGSNSTAAASSATYDGTLVQNTDLAGDIANGKSFPELWILTEFVAGGCLDRVLQGKCKIVNSFAKLYRQQGRDKHPLSRHCGAGGDAYETIGGAYDDIDTVEDSGYSSMASIQQSSAYGVISQSSLNISAGAPAGASPTSAGEAWRENVNASFLPWRRWFLSSWPGIRDSPVSLPWKIKVNLARSAAKSVAQAHQENVVHRDLAVRNLLLQIKCDEKNLDNASDDDHVALFGDVDYNAGAASSGSLDLDFIVKLSDFGLSKFNKSSLNTSIDHDGSPLQYMPPESLIGRQFGPASDVWGLGVVLWEIMTNAASPYPGKTVKQAAYDVVYKDLRLPVPKEIPSEYAQVMLGCWVKEPNLRLTAKQVYDKLDEYWQTLE